MSNIYRVLARKYRPQTFADLIGQEVLVRTLSNAFANGRIAHAFLLTGIRGIGKTTTARIIARGLNCIGPDGNGEATTTPCGVCPNCIAIAQDRHVDVIEMDAASNTGVDNMRDLIDSVQYAPTAARYKVYIIDEVHMLSKSAFNAILKTLEEPPPHVKFIFATTEIRKIPVTIISRCQRFDLKRVEMEELSQHLIAVAAKESIALAADCAALIAAAAEGSVRDSLSLLDRAIAMHTDAAGDVVITPESVRDMLGLADKTQSFTLLKLLFAGKADEALAMAQKLHHQGADPLALLADLLDITHYLTRIVVAPKLLSNLHYSPAEQALAQEMAASLNVPALTRAWQILTKGAEEMRHATHAPATLEMILVRLGYASNLPTPAELVRQLGSGGEAAASRQSPVASKEGVGFQVSGFSGQGSGVREVGNKEEVTPTNAIASKEDAAIVPPPSGGRTGGGRSMASTSSPTPPPQPTPNGGGGSLGAASTGHRIVESSDHHAATSTARKPDIAPLAQPASFDEIVALFESKREVLLAAHLINDMRLVSFAPGRIEVKPISHMNPDVPARINRRLAEWTGEAWNLVYHPQAQGALTIREQRALAAQQARDYAVSHPKVQAVLEMFPDAKVIDFVPNKT